jgi:hypothetical protein
MPDSERTGSTRWRKSPRSASDGACVEVAGTESGIAVRDSKDPDGPVLHFRARAWQRFVDGLRASDAPG